MDSIGRPLSHNTRDNEQNKFKEDSTGRVAVNVTGTVDVNNGLVLGRDYNKIDVSYPDETTEVFQYKLDNVTIQTITVSYLNSEKDDISGVVIL